MHILTLLALLTLLSLGVQLLVSDKVDAVHYGLVLLAGVLILGGQIHENKLNQTLTANKYRTTVTYDDVKIWNGEKWINEDSSNK